MNDNFIAAHPILARSKIYAKIENIDNSKIESSEDAKSTIKHPSEIWTLKQANNPETCSIFTKKSTLKQNFVGYVQKQFGHDSLLIAIGDNAPLDSDDDFNELPIKKKRLILKIISSLSIVPGTEILIGTKGLVGGHRNSKDCCTYFGNKLSDNNLIDYVVPLKEEGIGSTHFVIYYNKTNNCYQIKDLGNGKGTFILITRKYPVMTGNVFSFGEVHITTILDKDELRLKVQGVTKINTKL